MNPLIAAIGFTDLAVIAIIVIGFCGTGYTPGAEAASQTTVDVSKSAMGSSSGIMCLAPSATV